VEAQKAVGEDSAIEEGTELTLDEARHDTVLDTGIRQPSLEVVLDYAVENRRLGTARGVFGHRHPLTALLHEVIVES